VLLVVAGWTAWRHDPSPSWALLTPHLRAEPPPLERHAQIKDLRDRALLACSVGASAACLADTDAADALDPSSARTWGSLRYQAMTGLMVQESSVDWDRQPAPRTDKGPAPGRGGP
jgi:hypothetical protein